MTNADQALLHSLVRGEELCQELGKKLRETTPTMVSFVPVLTLCLSILTMERLCSCKTARAKMICVKEG